MSDYQTEWQAERDMLDDMSQEEEVWGYAELGELDNTPLHISELEDKRATTILGSTLIDDEYHCTIMAAAGELVAAGLGHYTYVTQWGSGSTCWRDRDYTFVVDCYGRVKA